MYVLKCSYLRELNHHNAHVQDYVIVLSSYIFAISSDKKVVQIKIVKWLAEIRSEVISKQCFRPATEHKLFMRKMSVSWQDP